MVKFTYLLLKIQSLFKKTQENTCLIEKMLLEYTLYFETKNL